jgi:hypothetical protein
MSHQMRVGQRMTTALIVRTSMAIMRPLPLNDESYYVFLFNVNFQSMSFVSCAPCLFALYHAYFSYTAMRAQEISIS